MAGGRNKPTTPLPAWLTEDNDARRAVQAASRTERRVHCWVRGAEEDWPGIVLEWRREGAGWMARAAWTTDGGRLVVAWVEAEAVEPV